MKLGEIVQHTNRGWKLLVVGALSALMAATGTGVAAGEPVGPDRTPAPEQTIGSVEPGSVAEAREPQWPVRPSSSPITAQASAGAARLAAANVVPPALRTPCTTAPFPDVPTGHQFCREVSWLVEMELANGYTDGTFRPGAPVSRQAMAGFLFRLLNPGVDAADCEAAPFTDVPTTSQFCGAISWMVDSGLANGWADGTFRPANPVSRQAAAAFLYRIGVPPQDQVGCAESPFFDVWVDGDFCGAISWMVGWGITTGNDDGSFRPSTAVSRQAMGAFLFRAASYGALGHGESLLHGQLTSPTGQPITQAYVHLLDATGYWMRTVETDSTGSYSLPSLYPGDYLLCFEGHDATAFQRTTGFRSECWNDRPWNAAADHPLDSGVDPVRLVKAGTWAGATLAVGGAVAGTITSAIGPAEGVVLRVYDSDGNLRSDGITTGADGSYRQGGLPPGSYVVCLDGSEVQSAGAPFGLVGWCTGGAVHYPLGVVRGATTPVAVGADTVATVSTRLATAGGVSGTVTTPYGTFAGLEVFVLEAGGTAIDAVVTDDQGGYRRNGFPPGTYYVCVNTWPVFQGAMGHQCWQDGYNWVPGGPQAFGSDPVAVQAGQNRTADVAVAG